MKQLFIYNKEPGGKAITYLPYRSLSLLLRLSQPSFTFGSPFVVIPVL